ncbi:MAG: SPOR domain-containing protein [Candidatus Omnitrophica bacterium]|nr:SPOR domain-containing protein [Candidatus Omnitrophota bacterium]
MALDKGKGSWLIAVLVIVALGFIFLAFSKEKPKASQAPAPESKAAPNIKAAHSTEEEAAIGQTKPQPAVIMAPQQVTPRDTYAIQVYSFKDKARAEAALDKLKAKNYKAYIMVSDLGARGVWYRVRVGTFTSEDEAKKIFDSVANDFKSGIIVTE